MNKLIFETHEVLLTLGQDSAEDDTPFISFKLRLSAAPTIYFSNGETLHQANWTMEVRRMADGVREPDWLTYAGGDGSSQCLLLIHQSSSSFQNLLDMLKGGHASEITVDVDGMEPQGDYSCRWDTGGSPRLEVQRVSFEFPLPQNEA